MSKLIKHEFRATARIIVPMLIICAVSSVLFAAFSRMEKMPEQVKVIFGFLCIGSVMAIGIMCLVVMINRFYYNTMTDTGYLTMTLPLNTREFVRAEIVNDIIWLLIVSVAIIAIFLCSLSIADMFSFPSSVKDYFSAIRQLKTELAESNINIVGLSFIAVELIIGALLAFTGFCQRFYVAMAVSQLSSKHRGLLAVIVYIGIGVILAILLVGILNVLDGNIPDSAHNLGQVMKMVGLLDLIALAINAILYFTTAIILEKKLNLQ